MQLPNLPTYLTNQLNPKLSKRDQYFQALQMMTGQDRAHLLGKLTSTEYYYLFEDPYAWDLMLRPDQLKPLTLTGWRLFFYLAGRGNGKSAAANYWLANIIARSQPGTLVGISSQKEALARQNILDHDTHGLLHCFPYTLPSLKRYDAREGEYLFDNGVKLYVFSGEQPDNIRGKNLSYFLADELVFYPNADYCYSACLKHAVRKNKNSQIMITTTPNHNGKNNGVFLKKLLAEPRLVRQGGSMWDNAKNLDPLYVETQTKQHYTRQEREELFGEILTDGGAVFDLRHIKRAKKAPELKRIVVSIDPATSQDGTTGIMVGGIHTDPVSKETSGYLLNDCSTTGIPEVWVKQAVNAYYAYQANYIVAEANQGGEMVKTLLRMADRSITVKLVYASHGKVARAEPISSLYSSGLIYHVGEDDAFQKLEEQMLDFDPLTLTKRNSPDRLDAMVWLFSDLMLTNAAPPSMIQRPLHLGF